MGNTTSNKMPCTDQLGLVSTDVLGPAGRIVVAESKQCEKVLRELFRAQTCIEKLRDMRADIETEATFKQLLGRVTPADGDQAIIDPEGLQYWAKIAQEMDRTGLSAMETNVAGALQYISSSIRGGALHSCEKLWSSPSGDWLRKDIGAQNAWTVLQYGKTYRRGSFNEARGLMRTILL